uniref:CA domain-containing protein n=1 Tax=Gongylonema pulchrum TaxID=637853 RepID=A0A183EFA5_9BILA
LVYQLFLDASLPEREPSPYFAIDSAMGLVRLKKALDYDDDTQPKHHQLKVYSLSDDHFKINDRGEISARKRLDADQNRERFYIYRFNVTATDRGEPPLSSTAAVHIRTENTNDEAPIFIPTGNYQAYVAEDAQGGTPVVQIQAIDPDRDQVFYAFLLPNGNEAVSTGLFEIDRDTGRLFRNFFFEFLLLLY